MHEKEPTIDIRIIEAMEKFRQALEKAKEAQDPLVKETLRQKAIGELYKAADLVDIINKDSSEEEELEVGPISEN